jgi:hypothetical protein
MTDDARWTALFDRIALFLTLLAFLLRLGLPNTTSGVGLNLFLHLLFWIALTLWFAGRALGGGGVYRFTGFEFAFLAFAVACLLSVLRATYVMTALDHAFTFLSLSLFFILGVQVLGKRLLRLVCRPVARCPNVISVQPISGNYVPLAPLRPQDRQIAHIRQGASR